MKIQIDLPLIVLMELEDMARKENRSRKNYIESVLIRLAEPKPQFTQEQIDNELAKHI